MRKKDRRTLDAIFAKPLSGNIEWRAVEALFRALGGELTEHKGSGIDVTLNDVDAVFHRPHPRRECGKGLVKRVREFLNSAGVEHD